MAAAVVPNFQHRVTRSAESHDYCDTGDVSGQWSQLDIPSAENVPGESSRFLFDLDNVPVAAIAALLQVAPRVACITAFEVGIDHRPNSGADPVLRGNQVNR